ncbi:MAG TPA: hypothetical protein VGI99_02865, partial [Gemmataceae bacterium]
SDKELSLLEGSFGARLKEYRGNPAAAKKLLAIGEAPADSKLNPGELAAYAVICGMMLNLDEVVTKE